MSFRCLPSHWTHRPDMYSTQTDILIRPTKGQVDATGSAFHPHHHPQIFCFVLFFFFFFFFFFKPDFLQVCRVFDFIDGECCESQRRGGLFKNESFNRFIIHKCCRQTGRQAACVMWMWSFWFAWSNLALPVFYFFFKLSHVRVITVLIHLLC